jgi:carboxyl-terminal processing protease
MPLVAIDDGFDNLTRSYLHESPVGEFSAPIRSEMLPNGYGYLQVQFLAPTLAVPFPLQEFKAALIKMSGEDVPGIVLDLRNNTGGPRELIADALGHFVVEDTFFEDMAYFDKETGDFTVASAAGLTIKPRRPYIEKPMAVLVDFQTAGGGEGMARLLGALPQVVLVGICPTHGSFAPGGGYIELPNGAAVYYPLGRSLDAEGQIQGESGGEGAGGVAPEVVVPLTRETVHQILVDGQDVVLNAALEALKAPEAAPQPAAVQ